MQHSETINELAWALAKAQAKIEGAAKSSTNPHFKSKYADLAEVWSACRPALTENGISIVQSPEYVQGGVIVTTMLMHSTGQWLSSQLFMPVKQADNAQAVGSAITYARRYALASMVGIAPEDDDGNAAAEGSKNGNGTAPTAKNYQLRKEPEEEVAPKENPANHAIEGTVQAKGKLLAEINPADLNKALNNPVVARKLTPADKANIKAYLAKFEAMKREAAAEGTSLEEDEIPA